MFLSDVIVIVASVTFAAAAVRGLGRREQKLALIAFVLHVVCSFANWAMYEHFYGIGDIYGYQSYGIQLARLLDADPLRFFPEVGRLALHLETNLPLEVTGDGSSTGTMSALASLFVYLTGPSLLTMCLMTTGFSWFGQLCLYRVARCELDPEDQTAALIGFMFVPSVIFWGAGFHKEAFVVGFFGILCLCTYLLVKTKKTSHIVGIGVGAVGVAIIKSYTLFAYIIALGAFLYADHAWRGQERVRVRPLHVLVALIIAVGGIAAMGAIFPEFRPDRVAETLAQQQEAGRYLEGGSNVEMGSGEARTISQQLKFVPLAFTNALFRPSIFEARNAPSFLAGIEMTLLALGVLSLVGPGRRSIIVRSLIRDPLLIFCIVFVLVFGIAVGLGSTNMGSLSRYRLPMMPFYVTTLLVLRRRITEASLATRSRSALLGGPAHRH